MIEISYSRARAQLAKLLDEVAERWKSSAASCDLRRKGEA
jgi:hypothetical protein